jgi:hypothetical protein
MLRQQTPVHNLIEIEDETNETTSERKDEINIVDVNDKLQLNIEKEKVILISDDRDTFKEKYNINYNDDNIFKVIHILYEYFTNELAEFKIQTLFNDETIER